jgi:hypothetical protein
MRLGLFVLLILLVLFIGCGGSKKTLNPVDAPGGISTDVGAPVNEYTIPVIVISGSVRATDGTPISGAKVKAIPEDNQGEAVEVEATTNDMGKWALELIPYKYSIKVEHEGYKESFREMGMWNRNTSNVDFAMEALALILVEVYDENDALVRDALVRVIEKGGGSKIITADQDEDKGRFLATVSSGMYTVEARSERKLAKEDIEITGGGKIPVRLKLVEIPDGEAKASEWDDRAGGVVETNP